MNVSRRGQTLSTWKITKKTTPHVWSQCNRTLKISRFYTWETYYFKTLSKHSNQPIRGGKKDYWLSSSLSGMSLVFFKLLLVLCTYACVKKFHFKGKNCHRKSNRNTYTIIWFFVDCSTNILTSAWKSSFVVFIIFKWLPN